MRREGTSPLPFTAYTIYTDLSTQRRMPYDGYPEHRARPRSGRAQPDRYRPAVEKEGGMTHGNQSTSGGQQALPCEQGR